MYDNIKKWYDMGLWSAAQVRQAVLKKYHFRNAI